MHEGAVRSPCLYGVYGRGRDGDLLRGFLRSFFLFLGNFFFALLCDCTLDFVLVSVRVALGLSFGFRFGLSRCIKRVLGFKFVCVLSV